MDFAHTSEEGAESDGDLFTLRDSTLVALTSFLDQQSAELEAISSLTTLPCPQQDWDTFQPRAEIPSSSLSKNQPRPQGDINNETNHIDILGAHLQPKALRIEEYKRVFKENWQLSQFWYTKDTASRLAQAIKRVCNVNAHVAFMCCPTGYVAFKETALPFQNVILLEYDKRFSLVAGSNFVHYDLDEPLSPGIEALRASQDVVVVDPPFHSEMSQKNIASTVAHILRPGGRLVLLTGMILAPLIVSIYGSSLPKLRRRGIVIDHDGVGRLATPYGCWVGGGSDSNGDRAFGEPICDEL